MTQDEASPMFEDHTSGSGDPVSEINNAPLAPMVPDQAPTFLGAPHQDETQEDLDLDEPDLDEQELGELIHGNDPESGIWSATERELEPIAVVDTKSALTWSWRLARSNGFSVIISLMTLMVTLGLLGYSAGLGNPWLTLPVALLVLACTVWVAIAWRRWLACAPYFYRLMISLGENAENLHQMTLLRAVRRISAILNGRDNNTDQ